MGFTVEFEGIAELEADILKAKAAVAVQAEIAMWEAVRLVEAEAKTLAPRRTGRLAASIDAHVENQPFTVIGEVGTNVDYARPIEFGQKPHFIAGREMSPITGKTKLLKFEMGGQTWFKQWVYHTGARAYEFLGGALDHNEELIIDRFRKVRDHVADILKG